MRTLGLLLSAPAAAAGHPISLEANAPLLAFLLSTLLKGAEGELQGHSGSRPVRTAALRAVRQLLQAAGPGDALAFVVPGCSSGLAKALTVAGEAALPSAGSGLCWCSCQSVLLTFEQRAGLMAQPDDCAATQPLSGPSQLCTYPPVTSEPTAEAYKYAPQAHGGAQK